MSIRVASACRARVVMMVGLIAIPAVGRAEDLPLPSRALTSALTSALATAPAPSLSGTPWAIEPDQVEAPPVDVRESATPRSRPRPGVLLPLYLSFGALQVADAYSTLRAVGAGATELNPVFRQAVHRPAAFVALKAGMAASTVLLTEKFRASHPTGAVVLMVVLNSVYATLVTHNYRAIP